MDTQPELDVIREQIEGTRSSLTEKLETLEADVKETVESAKETVESAREAVEETLTTARETVRETISSVTETVHDATESVKRNLDLEYQVHRHPWAMLGLSLVSGVALGAFLGGRRIRGRRVAQRLPEAAVEPPERAPSAPAAPPSRLTHEGPNRPGFMDKLTSQLGAEFEKAKDLAIATLVGAFRDVAKRSIPALGSAVEDLMTHAASQLAAPPQQHGARSFPVTARPSAPPRGQPAGPSPAATSRPRG
ncbi:MAG TPA: hypothetical protein VKA46_02190 [Gemmataceae bacterium]|nr:hypothetical protein [Gemmataceae bacterium]